MNTGVQYLESLARQAGDDRDLQRELARAFIKVGDLLGNSNFPNLGRPDAAAASYAAALASLGRLEARAPGDDRVERFLGLTFERVGTLHEAAGRLPAAVTACQESFRRRTELARSVPFHTDVERDVAIAYEKLGNVHRLAGNYRAAEDNYRGGLGRFERLLQVDPLNARAIRSLAISEEKLSLALAEGGAPVDEARRLLQQARSGHETVADRDASNAQAQCDVARVTELTGDLDAREGRARGTACPAWRDSLTRHRRLAVVAPNTCDSAQAVVRLTAKAGGCH